MDMRLHLSQSEYTPLAPQKRAKEGQSRPKEQNGAAAVTGRLPGAKTRAYQLNTSTGLERSIGRLS
ncbi:MAG: hypothetical protein RR917_00485, partial [Eggerthellaceae bacterium]